MSVLLGENKWKTRDELIQEKLGNKVVEMNNAMYWGKMAEPMIARHIESNLPPEHMLFNPESKTEIVDGLSIEMPGHQLEHKDHPFIVGSPDRIVVDKSTLEVVEGVEIKTAFEWVLKSWKKEVPKPYQIQCQTYMMVSELDHWKICALIGNRTYLEFIIEEDLLLQDEMIEEAIKFNKEVVALTNKNAEEALDKYEQLLENKEVIGIPMGKG